MPPGGPARWRGDAEERRKQQAEVVRRESMQKQNRGLGGAGTTNSRDMVMMKQTFQKDSRYTECGGVVTSRKVAR